MFMCQGVLWVPCALGLIAVCAVVTIERMGAGDAIGEVPRNSAEAAGMASASEVLRFLRLGDPNTVYPVDPRFISSAVHYATTLEAAVLTDQVELVELLDREGAIIDAEQRHSLACLAADLSRSDVAIYLAPDGPEECEPDAEYERVLARTRDAAPE